MLFVLSCIAGASSSVWPQTHGNAWNTRESTLEAPIKSAAGLGFEVWVDKENAIHNQNVVDSGYSVTLSLYTAMTTYEFEDMPFYQVSSFVFNEYNDVVISRAKNVAGHASIVSNNSLDIQQAPLFTRPNTSTIFVPGSPYLVSWNGYTYFAHGNVIFRSETNELLTETLEIEVEGIEACTADYYGILISSCEWINSLWIWDNFLYVKSNFGNIWYYYVDNMRQSIEVPTLVGRISDTVWNTALVHEDFMYISHGGSVLRLNSINHQIDVFKVTNGILITSPQMLGIDIDGTPYVLVLDDADSTVIYVINGNTGSIVATQEFSNSKVIKGVHPVVSNFSFVIHNGSRSDWTIPIDLYNKVCLEDEDSWELCFAGLAEQSNGIVKYVFDPTSGVIETSWFNMQASCPGSSGTVSTEDNEGKRIYYCIGASYSFYGLVGMTTLDALDWDTGSWVFQYQLGRHSLITPAISEVVIGPDTAIYYGANGGIGRISTSVFTGEPSVGDSGLNNLQVGVIVVAIFILFLCLCLLSGKTQDWCNIIKAKKESARPFTDYAITDYNISNSGLNSDENESKYLSGSGEPEDSYLSSTHESSHDSGRPKHGSSTNKNPFFASIPDFAKGLFSSNLPTPKSTASNIKVSHSYLRSRSVLLADMKSSAQNVDLKEDGTSPKRNDELSWEHISISTKKGDRKVLKGLSGSLNSGQMWAIMGPSGCGKTTLLNILAGRTNSMTYLTNYRGRVAINKIHVNASLRMRLAAYVRQEDIFFAELTVEEVLTFAAKLKLPRDDYKKVNRKNDSGSPGIVIRLMNELDLIHIADVRVGDTLKKGISGGEKKRLSIGVELVTDPTIIFLDEPTSGLDSVATFMVCKILKNLSQRNNCIVMATIHQPSTKTFELFDYLYLMRSGQCVYSEPRTDLLRIFKHQGHIISKNTNPADFALETLLGISDKRFQRMVHACKDRNADKWESISRGMTTRENINTKLMTKLKEFESGELQTRWIQIKNLLRRGWKRRKRVRGSSLAILVQPIIIFLFQGILALNTGAYRTTEVLDTDSFGGTSLPISAVCTVTSDVCPTDSFLGVVESVRTRDYYVVYALITVVIFMISINASNSTILTIPTETPIRTREIQSNLYTALPYVLAKMIIDLPITILFFIGGFALVYLMVPFTAPFYNFALIIALHSCASISLAWLISTIARNPNSALQLSNLAFAPQILFSGLMVRVNDIPVSLRWIHYFCYLKYSINLCVIIELGYDPLAKDYLVDNVIDENLGAAYASVLVCFTLFCIFSTIYIMNRRNLGTSLDLGASPELLLTIREPTARGYLTTLFKTDRAENNKNIPEE